MKASVHQQWQFFFCLFLQASDGTCWGCFSKETDTMATWMSLASLSSPHLWMSVRGPEKTLCPLEGWVCHSVIFKLDSISPNPPLLNFGPHMRFISICRNCETFTTMDCDRFHKLNFTVAFGGGGSAHHLLMVTIPDTSIRGCLSAIANSPVDNLGKWILCH